jgi:arylsulfatase K
MSTRQNILFIHTDSMDGRAMGCMGHPSLAGATPVLDQLHRDGMLFCNAYSNNPICCPSRASMLSGRFTHHCEGWNNFKGLEPGEPTFLDQLAQAGYRLNTLGKMDYLSGHHTERARVSPWTRSACIMRPNYRMNAPQVLDTDERRVHSHDWDKIDAAGLWLRERAGQASPDHPFFLYIGLNAPHPPFTTSRHYLDRIDPARVAIPPDDPTPHPALAYQRTVKNWMHGFSDDTVRLVRRIYFAMIAEVDAMAGQMLKTLDELDLADSTYVIFSSDHGEMAMEHRQFYKMAPYEPSVRVPLLIRGPGVRKNSQTDTLVSLVDVYPTLMDMAGLPQPRGLDGYSLMPLLQGGRSRHPGWVLSENHESSCCTGTFMLRQGDWKYIAYAGMAPLLFNLRDDPGEVHDLAGSRADKVRELDAVLKQVVDYEQVDAKVKAYDKASFAAWRREHSVAGDYRTLMSRIFSGWDRLPAGEGVPWTDDDEKQIERWLR